MIPVAVVLIVLVIVFTIAIIIGNPQAFDLQVFVARIPANITGVYVTGAVTMLVLAVAGWLLWSGIIRMRAQQQEIRALKAAAGARTKSIPAGDKAAKPAGAGGSGTRRDPDAVAKRDREPVGGAGARDGGTKSAVGSADDKGPAETAGSRRTAAAESAEESRPTKDSGLSEGDNAAPDSSRADDHEGRKGSGRRDDKPATTAEERRRMLAEADELTGDDTDK
ncbi:hypothetical protein [Microlunatus speluncae]|uniref:hypothetical protein n=1 Tax=Microlunatus speluncae TaxID=2594267 RepID=UPI00126649D2|nr:hypothetical protein [Microlunatus speluncae]